MSNAFQLDIRFQQLAKTMYDAYCRQTGYKSAVTGADLPVWENVKPEIAAAWMASAKAAYEHILGD